MGLRGRLFFLPSCLQHPSNRIPQTEHGIPAETLWTAKFCPVSFMRRSNMTSALPWQHDPSKSHSARGLPVNWSFLLRIASQLVYFLSCAYTSVGLLSDVMHRNSSGWNGFLLFASQILLIYIITPGIMISSTGLSGCLRSCYLQI